MNEKDTDCGSVSIPKAALDELWTAIDSRDHEYIVEVARRIDKAAAPTESGSVAQLSDDARELLKRESNHQVWLTEIRLRENLDPEQRERYTRDGELWAEIHAAASGSAIECRSVSRVWVNVSPHNPNKGQAYTSAEAAMGAKGSESLATYGPFEVQNTEQESVSDDSDLIDEDPLPPSWTPNFPRGCRRVGTWAPVVLRRRDAWAHHHGWPELARTTEEKSVSEGSES